MTHSKLSSALLVCSLLAGCATTAASSGQTTPTNSSDVPLSESINAPRTIAVRSAEFADGAAIPAANSFSGFGCAGQNTSPSLSWTGAPETARSFAIIAHDPDAPTGVGFFHWLVFDLPASTRELAAGAALPSGAIAGRTDFGSTAYGGPCPPPGSPHRYVFTVYALDVPSLGLTDPPSGALLRFMLAQHTVAYGRLTGTFQR